MDSTGSTAAPTSSERHYELLVQAVSDYAIYMLDLQGHITSWNTGASRIKGYSAEEVLGQPLELFYTDADRQANKPAQLMAQALADGRAQDQGWRVRKDGSHFWALVVLDLIRDANDQVIGFAKITRDMTQSHEAEQRLEAMREQLFQAQKLEALGQLTGGMAHDFNNLLTIIISAARLPSRTDNPQRRAELLESIHSAGQRGSQMTQHLLTFARRGNLQTQVLDLHDILPATQTFLAQALPKHIRLSGELAPDLHPVMVDPSQLEMALLNLVFNARDAIEGSGDIHLRAVNRTLQGEWDGLRGDFVVISIADSGIGIDASVLPRIFEPFFTTKAFGQGTGLGLSQVYGLLKRLGGSVRVDSALGRGTTVSLFLPAVAPG
jgi:PAS domain S-box-containing protein